MTKIEKTKTQIYYENNKEKMCKKSQLYYKKNKSQKAEYDKIYAEKNKVRIAELSKIYRKNNKKDLNIKRRLYEKNRTLNEPLYKLTNNIRTRISISITRQNYTKRSKTYQILGCSFEEFKQHLERQFTEGMNWENQGEWHLDHIYPVSLAKDEEELIRLNHYTNFQPLWAIDNLKKGNKITEQQLILI